MGLPVVIGAPKSVKEFCIEASVGIESYEPLVRAVYMYESKGDSLAYNPKEGAVGGFQIRQCRIDHYNELKGTNYCLEDCYSYTLSREIFIFFAQGKTYEQAAKSWNGSGPMTEEYWKQIKEML
jgi:hypothetical protein